VKLKMTNFSGGDLGNKQWAMSETKIRLHSPTPARSLVRDSWGQLRKGQYYTLAGIDYDEHAITLRGKY
jgi:hypothetical protein